MIRLGIAAMADLMILTGLDSPQLLLTVSQIIVYSIGNLVETV